MSKMIWVFQVNFNIMDRKILNIKSYLWWMNVGFISLISPSLLLIVVFDYVASARPGVPDKLAALSLIPVGFTHWVTHTFLILYEVICIYDFLYPYLRLLKYLNFTPVSSEMWYNRRQWKRPLCASGNKKIYKSAY